MTESNTCSTCGGELLTNSGQTFCPACLLQQGMKSSTYGGGSKPAWKPPEMEQLAAAFPQLEIQQLLGVGGMGAVYKVRQKELDRVAALKVLPGEMAVDAGFTERFLREARLLASLGHPHIVTVYEFGQRDGSYFLLMEFVDGVTLRQALRAEPIRKLDSKEALAIVGQLCDALQFAHDEGVVHRDIKPENILIDKRGRVKIADFGLAKLLGQSPTMPTLTGTHQLMGTPAYMAPEQIEGLPGIDHRADIYSMGVVFYELLTGELPLGRFSPPSERAETDVRLDEVVFRTLAKDPGRRYQQASHVKTDVEALRSPVIHAAPSNARHAGRICKAICIVTVVFLAVLLFLFEAKRPIPVDASTKQNSISKVQPAESPNILHADAKQHVEVVPALAPDPMAAWGIVDSRPAILFDDSGPHLNAKRYKLSAEQLGKVNEILKIVHERYLREESLHSTISVDSAGVQTTEIKPFPEQLRLIENDFWSQLDDVVPIETQKKLRDSLILFYASMFPVDTENGGEGFAGGMMQINNATNEPGVFGWEQSQLPVRIRIGRSGHWFEWSIHSEDSDLGRKKAPTLPISLQRFFPEPGPWIAVANAKAAYEMKNWMQVADAFTRGGRFRWYLTAEAQNASTANNLPEFGNEIARLNEFFERTRPPIEKDEEILRQLEEIKTLIRSCSAIAVGGLCQQGGQTFSEDLGKAWFLMSVIDAATRKTVIFEPATYSLEGVQIDERNNANGQLVSPDGTKSVPIEFLFLDEQWKISSIGSDEELQDLLKLEERQRIGGNPLAAFEAYRKALIDGKFPIAVKVLTDDARDEWIGEMLAAIAERYGLGNVKGRWQQFDSDQEDPELAGMRETFVAQQGDLSSAISGYLAETEIQEGLNNPASSREDRRTASIRLAQKLSNRDELLTKLLESRVRMKVSLQIEGVLSETQSGDSRATQQATWTGTSRKDLPPLDVAFVQVDGLWKINTLIDSALTPWPLAIFDDEPKGTDDTAK